MSELWTIQVVFLKSRLYNRPGQNASLFCGGSFGGTRKVQVGSACSRGKSLDQEKARTRIGCGLRPPRVGCRLSLLHSVTLRLKTVHRTVFTAESPLLLPAHSNPPLSNSIKKVTPLCGITFFGGKRGIRTLGAFIGHTRFPVVRLRPAQPSFHNGFCCVHSTRKCLIIISGRSKKVKHFLEKNGEIFRRVDGQPKV